MKLVFTSILLLLFILNNALAQSTGAIDGTITDEQNLPLEFVNVVIEKNGQGTITN
mgnify:CR=1 FL=1